LGFPWATLHKQIDGFVPGTSRYGEDVILTNVLSFDVKAYDPDAPVRYIDKNSNGLPDDDTSVALQPSDPGYFFQGSETYNRMSLSTGAFVDLGYGVSFDFPNQKYDVAKSPVVNSWFSALPNSKSKLTATGVNTSPAPTYYPCTYDTWSLHYENNSIDEDDGGSGLVDEGMNGFDDDGDGVVDEADEYETQPPYIRPLRGIQVTIRIYEPDSRQVREVTVVQDFVP
jgi:hypothetical protein